MHSLCACGAQLVHLQPEKYFRPGTRPGRKWILTLFAAAAANSARHFFDTLICPSHSVGAFLHAQRIGGCGVRESVHCRALNCIAELLGKVHTGMRARTPIRRCVRDLFASGEGETAEGKKLPTSHEQDVWQLKNAPGKNPRGINDSLSQTRSAGSRQRWRSR